MRLHKFILFLILVLLGAAPSAEACSVCFGAPGSDLSESMSKAILFLLAVLGVVLAAIVTFILSIWRRSKRLTHLSAHT
ncbi:MAG: hypothetical protein SNJ52_04730 [Verrucomicrobiia bacterium]